MSAETVVGAGLSTSSISELEKRVSELETTKESLLDKNGLQEQELNRIRTQMGSMREERDKFRRRASTPLFCDVEDSFPPKYTHGHT